MSYSNGFDLSVVLPALKGRLGWRSQISPVPARRFESFHALCTEQNLKDTQPTENIPDNDFQTLKDQIETDIIQRCLSSVFSRPEFIDQVLLHKREFGTQNQLIDNSSQFVGIRFNVAAALDVTVEIKTVTLLLDQTKTFNLYLYRDGDPTPIDAIQVTTIANEPALFDMSQLELLSYAKWGSTNFYLGYFQDDLGSARAIREMVCFNGAKAFGHVSFSAPKVGSGFNMAQIGYGYVDTFGMNAEVRSFRDYTHKIINNPALFDEAIGLSMVYYVIEQILASTRSNSTERILKDGMERITLQHYLYGAVPAMGVAKTVGLNDIINKKFSEIRESFYPCPKAQTVNLCS